MTARPKTILDFKYKTDIRPVVEKWATKNAFKFIKDAKEGAIEYQHSGGLMMCPIILHLQQTNENVHIEVWLQMDLLTEFANLFAIPHQSGIETDINGLFSERQVARFFINKLLKELKQPPIQ